MQDLYDDIFTTTWLPFTVIAGRLLAAAFFGALIGLEREWQSHPAGLRTHMLVSLAAATFAILGIEIVHSEHFQENAIQLDPLRLIEAVTAGVAFLAAGTIIVSRGKVKGLTTGAGLWLSGAIGLAGGLGYWQIAGLGTLLAIIVLALLHQVSKAVDRRAGRSSEPPAPPA